jgi:predicted dehydrogenase
MKQNDALKILIIGCGKIAAKHADGLKARGVQLSFYSRSKEKAEGFSRKFSGTPFSGNLNTVLNNKSWDAVWVCTPPSTHAEIIEQCLELKLKVFCEKPLVSTLTELERLEKNPATPELVMVGENYLYRPMLKWLNLKRETLDLGQVRKIKVRKESFQPVSGWRVNESALVEGGIHFVALILEILDYPKFRSIEVGAKNNQKSFLVKAHTQNEQIIELKYSWTNFWSLPAGLLQSSTIVFERGSICFESNGLYAKVFDEGGSPVESKWFTSDLGGFNSMTDDALLWIRGEALSSKSSFAKGAAALRFAFGLSS